MLSQQHQQWNFNTTWLEHFIWQTSQHDIQQSTLKVICFLKIFMHHQSCGVVVFTPSINTSIPNKTLQSVKGDDVVAWDAKHDQTSQQYWILDFQTAGWLAKQRDSFGAAHRRPSYNVATNLARNVTISMFANNNIYNILIS